MILTFKPQFVEPIKDGTKIHTIREDKNNRWKQWTKIQFWNGNPRNVKANPHQFQSGVCTDVKGIVIDFENNDIVIIGENIEDDSFITGINELNKFARNDGFESWESLKQWFFNEYGKNRFFHGKLIYFKVYATRKPH